MMIASSLALQGQPQRSSIDSGLTMHATSERSSRGREKQKAVTCRMPVIPAEVAIVLEQL
jgi:hypothetical protein